MKDFRTGKREASCREEVVEFLLDLVANVHRMYYAELLDNAITDKYEEVRG